MSELDVVNLSCGISHSGGNNQLLNYKEYSSRGSGPV